MAYFELQIIRPYLADHTKNVSILKHTIKWLFGVCLFFINKACKLKYIYRKCTLFYFISLDLDERNKNACTNIFKNISDCWRKVETLFCVHRAQEARLAWFSPNHACRSLVRIRLRWPSITEPWDWKCLCMFFLISFVCKKKTKFGVGNYRTIPSCPQ